MSDALDLVIVGLGSGGLVAAEFAASLGLAVAAVERHRVGGDCLWTGCVPSKALLASAKAAATMRHADRYGLTAVEPSVDLAAVWRRIKAVQASIAATDDNPDRVRALGVELVAGDARLSGPNEVAVTLPGGEERRLSTRFVLLCTGSRPAEPPVPGLAEAGYLTSETVFELDRPPGSVIFVGGGPIAVELAQAFARLGVAATVLQRGPGILPRDEPELVAVLARRLAEDGVELHTGVEVTAVHVEADGARTVTGAVRGLTAGTELGAAQRWSAEGLFVAAGRRPNVEGLGLEALGIGVGPRGVEVDERGRTAVKNVYAAGDVAGRLLFTHSAGYEAVRAVRDAFFPGKGEVDTLIPWCTFTDPELAHAGLTIAEAEAEHGGSVEVHRAALSHSDRARADGAEDGGIVIVCVKGRVVGAHILAPAAGEMIHELALAIRHGLKLTDVASLVHVYPTLSSSIGRLASDAAFGRAQKLRWLLKRGAAR